MKLYYVYKNLLGKQEETKQYLRVFEEKYDAERYAEVLCLGAVWGDCFGVEEEDLNELY